MKETHETGLHIPSCFLQAQIQQVGSSILIVHTMNGEIQWISLHKQQYLQFSLPKGKGSILSAVYSVTKSEIRPKEKTQQMPDHWQPVTAVAAISLSVPMYANYSQALDYAHKPEQVCKDKKNY